MPIVILRSFETRILITKTRQTGAMMNTKNTHSQAVDKQFGSQAQDYLTSAVHSQGADLHRLAGLLAPYNEARVIDLGCGAGHASFVAAGVVKNVIAYDLSSQ